MKIHPCGQYLDQSEAAPHGGRVFDLWPMKKRPISPPEILLLPVKKICVSSLSWSHIDEICHKIWSYLDVVQLFQMRTICTLWKMKIEESIHLDFSNLPRLNPSQITILCSTLVKRFTKVEMINLRNQSKLREVHVKLLLKHFSDTLEKLIIKCQPRFLCKCLHYVCGHGIEKIIPNLLQQGACLLPHRHLNSPLYTASKGRHIHLMRLLLRLGADIRKSDDPYLSMLQLAAMDGDTERIKLLLDSGVYIDWITTDGSALMFAVKQKHYKAAQYLVSSGADIELCDHRGMTPFLLAVSTGNMPMIQLLRKKGADISRCDKKGHNALFYAQKHEKVVQYLVNDTTTPEEG